MRLDYTDPEQVYVSADDEICRLHADLEKTAQERDAALSVAEARRRLMADMRTELEDLRTSRDVAVNALKNTDAVNEELLETIKGLRAYIAVRVEGGGA